MEEERVRETLTGPDGRRMPESLDPSHKDPCSVSYGGCGACPCRGGHGQELSVFEPGVLESETFRFGDGGGDAGYDRDMIRGDPNPRGERSVGEGGAELFVNEGTVQPAQGRLFTFIGPSVAPVQQ